MRTLSELALKGHFEELKKQFSRSETPVWDQDLPEEITSIISRVIKMAEDFYEHDPEVFTNDHKENYQLMIKVLNNNGYSYKGYPDLMDDDQADKSFPEKKPMQKAGITPKQEQKKRDAG